MDAIGDFKIPNRPRDQRRKRSLPKANMDSTKYKLHVSIPTLESLKNRYTFLQNNIDIFWV